MIPARSKRLALAMLLTAFVTPSVVGGAASDASAQISPLRLQRPVMAGTKIRSASGANCTAGAVMKYSGIGTAISGFAAAKRYVLTSEHCGKKGEKFTLGSTVTGTVTWVSPDTDLELITVLPTSRTSRYCGPSHSGTLFCQNVTTYTPQADGRVVLSALNTGSPITPIVNRTGSPGDEESFCRSGAVGGVDCTLMLTHIPSPVLAGLPGVASASPTSRRASEDGDSGAPVTSGSGGFTNVALYGILYGGGWYGGVWKNHYITIAKFFEETSGYSLAPAL
ncbi:hypothetical protein ACR8AL_10140 [Clavibacter sepedonicus]|uniref:Pat-1 homologue n=1 Tax=Clavibacter sepedonicus TaxID=31964 RepID=B0RBL2_CLASE|nr:MULTISPECIES: hypothetical protein [Clavibacter]MBD5381803.1 hypothetical protein [Clavibacter sp.]OQJ48429.1 hypothetical protein B5P19_09245 [Clavibacter sepedonicus]OQJ53911.1 hypothetical protein B5P20_07085 [Clavibacter sepedonicus]UUK65429.1 S1 family peptidase [Clavibacter sepedonicus]CAQ02908.1 putative pat-1 homologue [Clavibacter sepedonicus]